MPNIVVEAVGSPIPAAVLLGMVAENAATNTCPQSQTFEDATWIKSDATITANTQAAPDGTLTADTFTDSAINASHAIYRTGVSVPASGAATHSLYAKQGTLPWIQLQVSATVWANFNLATGAVGFTSGVTATNVVALPNGWYRFSITWTAVAGNVAVVPASINANTNAAQPSYIGTGQTMFLWGAQVEQASDPSSYIPTTTVAVTRAADVLEYPAAGNIATVSVPFTAYLEAAYVTKDTVAQMLLGANSAFQLYFRGGGGVSGIDFYSNNGATSASKTLSVAARAALTKYACRKNSGTLDLDVFSSGVKGTTGAQGAQGAEIATIQVGAVNSTAQLNGSIRNVKIYNTALTDAQLQALTT